MISEEPELLTDIHDFAILFYVIFRCSPLNGQSHLCKKKKEFVYPRSTKELKELVQTWPCIPRSNWNLKMLVFEERGKPEFPEKNLSEQSREPTTNSTHI